MGGVTPPAPSRAVAGSWDLRRVAPQAPAASEPISAAIIVIDLFIMCSETPAPTVPYPACARRASPAKQLLGQYMLPKAVRFGVLLLVRTSKRQWKIERHWANLAGLRENLATYARDLGRKHEKTIAIEVIDALSKA